MNEFDIVESIRVKEIITYAPYIEKRIYDPSIPVGQEIIEQLDRISSTITRYYLIDPRGQSVDALFYEDNNYRLSENKQEDSNYSMKTIRYNDGSGVIRESKTYPRYNEVSRVVENTRVASVLDCSEIITKDDDDDFNVMKFLKESYELKPVGYPLVDHLTHISNDIEEKDDLNKSVHHTLSSQDENEFSLFFEPSDKDDESMDDFEMDDDSELYWDDENNHSKSHTSILHLEDISDNDTYADMMLYDSYKEMPSEYKTSFFSKDVIALATASGAIAYIISSVVDNIWFGMLLSLMITIVFCAWGVSVGKSKHVNMKNQRISNVLFKELNKIYVDKDNPKVYKLKSNFIEPEESNEDYFMFNIPDNYRLLDSNTLDLDDDTREAIRITAEVDRYSKDKCYEFYQKVIKTSKRRQFITDSNELIKLNQYVEEVRKVNHKDDKNDVYMERLRNEIEKLKESVAE